MTHLTPAELAAYERDGFLVRRGVLPDEVLESVREVMSRTVDRLARDWMAQGLISDVHEDEPFDTRWEAIRAQHEARTPSSWRKNPRGFRCASADPALIEPYDVWAERFRFGALGLAEELGIPLPAGATEEDALAVFGDREEVHTF